jgi:putative DNA methylase
MTVGPQYRKKLIEVALPLEAINQESAREKSIRHGHPSTLHLWWARRPLAACRAVLFASLVDDPSSHPDQFPTEEAQEKERQRLFRIIEELVKWENSNNEEVLEAARAEIRRSTGGNPPPVLDPFCGGGSIPLEAQRLGLEAYGSDLNPVAVLITKALIEIPPKFAGRAPVHPQDRQLVQRTWRGVSGLAEDVRYYGQWMRDEAEKRIGWLYPKVKLPKEYGGGEATVIAWLWARTVKCPNPACGAQMPLVRSFWLSTKKGKQAWVEPIVDKKRKTVRFEVRTGKGEPPEGTVNRRGALCIVCKTPVPFDHIRSEGKAGRMSAQLMAIVAEGKGGRVYVDPSDQHAHIARQAVPEWKPDFDLPHNPRDFKTPNYGMNTFADLFTPRQLVALTTFSDLVSEARERVLADARKAGLPDDGKGLNDGGTGASAYADAVATYLAFTVDKCADYWNTIATWSQSGGFIRGCFARQALPMTWDFAECNAFSESTANWSSASEWVYRSLLELPRARRGKTQQVDATTAVDGVVRPLICTDPPYYDNIGYADLSDFYYIWLRRSLGRVYPDLFSTVLVPKAQELVATPYRFGGDKEKARQFFETGLRKAFERMRSAQHPDYPLTVFYAFKQTEVEDEADSEDADASAVASTGWETMLEGLIKAGFAVTGTWPMRSERTARSVAIGTNALVSSIVLVCRPRPESAPLATRREFIAALKKELPDALKALQHGNIAPVDLAQAAIGPGMAVFTRYAKVLEADGTPMSVRTALQIINQELDAYLAAQEGEMDSDTRFCLAWFEQYGMNEGPFGEADVLARAKNTSVQGLADAGVLSARAGKVRLLKRTEYDKDWDPAQDRRLTVWECTQHLILQLNTKGEEGAALLCSRLGGDRSEDARALAYRLYSICERKGWTGEALAYNSLVVSWPAIQEKAARLATTGRQSKLFQ